MAHQGRPTAQDWTLWRATLTTVLNLQTPRRLRRPPGNWLSTETQCCWFFDLPTERLYQRQGNSTTYYPREAGRPSRAALVKFSTGLPTLSIPLTAEWATAERSTGTIWRTGHSPTTEPANLSRGQETLMDRLSRLDSDTSSAVTQVEFTDEGHAK
jgi:hypothetical protein